MGWTNLLLSALTAAGVFAIVIGIAVKDVAANLALATLTGAGALMSVEKRAPDEMRRAVTSPGGTTEAALNIFDGDSQRMRILVREAVKAAVN